MNRRIEKGRTQTLLAASALMLACATLGVGEASASIPASGASAGSDTSGPRAASIPFANQGAIFDWRSDGTKGIWVQAANGKWFYGTFVSACNGLDAAHNVGFVTNASGAFDQWSWILVRGQPPCHLANFTASEAPPDRKDGTDVASAAAGGNATK